MKGEIKMPKRVYKDPKGALEITKVEPTEEEKTINEVKIAKAKAVMYAEQPKVELTIEKAIKTAFTYAPVGLNITGESKKNTCLVCGAETSYSNRYICPTCFSKNKELLMEQIIANTDCDVLINGLK